MDGKAGRIAAATVVAIAGSLFAARWASLRGREDLAARTRRRLGAPIQPTSPKAS